MNNETLDKLIWKLIFGGLIVGGVGLALERRASTAGWLVATAGGLMLAGGALAVWLRSRRAP